MYKTLCVEAFWSSSDHPLEILDYNIIGEGKHSSNDNYINIRETYFSWRIPSNTRRNIKTLELSQKVFLWAVHFHLIICQELDRGLFRNWGSDLVREGLSLLQGSGQSLNKSQVGTTVLSQLELAMRLFFICAYAVAVYANWYAHIRMKPHRKIRIVYADMQIRKFDYCAAFAVKFLPPPMQKVKAQILIQGKIFPSNFCQKCGIYWQKP